MAYFTVIGMFLTGLQLFVAGPLGAAESMVGLAVGAFAVSAIALRPMLGRGIDRRGRKPYLLGSLALLSVSSVTFVVAESVAVVIALRVLQGGAAAAFYTTAASIVVDLSPLERRAAGIARFSLFLYAGMAVGPPLAEVLVEQLGFDRTWLVAGVLAAAGTACALAVAEPAIERAGPGERGRPRLFHPRALVPGIVLLMPSIGYASVVAFSALYAESIGMARSGVLYAAFAVTVIACRIVAGSISDRLGHRRVVFPGLGCSALGLGMLAVFPAPATAIAGVVLFGIGFALIFPALMALAVGRIPEGERGEGVATFTAFFDVGLGAGGFLIGVLVQLGGFPVAFGTAAALSLVGGVVLTLVTSDRAPAL